MCLDGGSHLGRRHQLADGRHVSRQCERPVEQGAGSRLRPVLRAEDDGYQLSSIPVGGSDDCVSRKRREPGLDPDGSGVTAEQAVVVLDLEGLGVEPGEVVGPGAGDCGKLRVTEDLTGNQGEVKQM